MWTLWVASDPANSDLHRVEAAARNLGGGGAPDDGSWVHGDEHNANLGNRKCDQ